MFFLGGMVEVRSQYAHIDIFHFCDAFPDIQIFRKKSCMPMLPSDYNLLQLLFQQKFGFCWKYLQILIRHNLGTSHQNFKTISGIQIDHKRKKICKNERFLKLSLFNAALFLHKMTLKVTTTNITTIYLVYIFHMYILHE